MASTLVDTSTSSSRLINLLKDISSKFSPKESEDVVQSLKRIYGERFSSLENQDLLSCLRLLHKLGYVSNTKLTLIKEFVAPKSSKKEDIIDAINNFKASHPPQVDMENELEGRSDDLKRITEKLVTGQLPVVNLYGSAGVGKTTLAKKVCADWRGKSYVFDLREARDIRAIYCNIMNTLKLTVLPEGCTAHDGYISFVIEKIHENIEKITEGQPVLFLLDDVERFTAGQGEESGKLRTNFVEFLVGLSGTKDSGNIRALNILLTSRSQLNDEGKVEDFELKPLRDSFPEEILLPREISYVNAEQKEKLLRACKGNPLLLKGVAAILRQGRKAPNDLINEIEKLLTCEGKTGAPVKSKLEEDAKEKPVDLQKDGVDEGQTSVIKEMFNSLPSDSLKVSAVLISLFCGPFSALTAAEVLGINVSEAVAQLEGLETSAIIHVDDREAKELMYDIHPLLKEYANSIRNEPEFSESYTKAKGRFYELFMSKMKTIAGLIDRNPVEVFSWFVKDQGNFQFTIDISLLPEYFRVPGQFRESAFFASLFNSMLSSEKQIELFHSWAEMCKDDGKSGSLFRAQLRCWEARQVLDVGGSYKAFEILQQAASSLEQVQDQSTESFKLTQGLFLYFEGEIHCQNRDYNKALECLKSSLNLTEELLIVDTNLARCYNAIGNCYYGLKKPYKSLEFYKRALKMREKLSGSGYHYDMPVYKNQIGTVHEDLGEYEEAVKWYKDALRLLEELKISGNEDEAFFCKNLANAYAKQKKFKEAIEPAERAYNIRVKRLGKHPDTVRSTFQQGVIQANLQDFDKALQLFLKAWEMEKSLQPGNHSPVLRSIIKGVSDMYAESDEKKNFRQEALTNCKRFWREEKSSAQFSFTAELSKDIIDTIMELLGDDEEKNRAARKEYEEEALWFYDGMLSANEEDFYREFDQESDNYKLNDLLRDRDELLNMIIDLCVRLSNQEKLSKQKRNKLTLYKTVLVKVEFVGEEEQEKAALKRKVEQLYQDLGDEESIPGFQENLLSAWQAQWEERTQETEEIMLARERIVKGILQLCQELRKEELRTRYGQEALSFYERLWNVKHREMERPAMEKFLRQIKGLASSVGDHDRVKRYSDAFQTLTKTGNAPGASLRQKEPLLRQTEEESEEEIKLVSEEEVEEASEEESEVGDVNVVNSRSITIKCDTVSKQGTHWDLKQVAAHVTFPPDAVSEDRTLTVLKWNPVVCSPPLRGNEAIVSDVIELSTDSTEGVQFNRAVKLAISHCAANLKGYEVAVKQLIDKENNTWVDIAGTVNLLSLADIKGVASASEIPDYLLPVAETKITQCSTFVVVCRLQSFKYTVTSEGSDLCVPEYPFVRVVIPKNAVQKAEELHVTVKIQEIPLKAFRGKEMFPGPILRITTAKAVEFQEPVTIQLPLSLREEQSCDIPDLSVTRIRILFKESSDEKREWAEITKMLESLPSCDGTVVKFNVKHFSDFWSWVEWCAKPIVHLVSGGNTGTESALERAINTSDSVGKAAFFSAYVPRDTRLGKMTKLRLYCCPTNKRRDMLEIEKEQGNILLEEQSSDELMYLEEKAYVFLAEGIVSPVKRESLQGFYVSFQDEACFKNLKVHVIKRGDLTVEFCSSQERDEEKMLCELEVTLPPPSGDPDKRPVEFFGLPFDDEILHDARLSDILVACKEVLQDIGRGEVYNDHFDLAPKSCEGDVKKSFFMALSRLPQECQEKCFDKIVGMLEEGGVGSEHIKEHLLEARGKVNQPPTDNVCSVVAEKLKLGCLWKTLARDLRPNVPDPVIETIEDEEKGNGKECCRVALREWYRIYTSKATTRELMRCLTNMGYANLNWHIMRELDLVSLEKMPESERLSSS